MPAEKEILQDTKVRCTTFYNTALQTGAFLKEIVIIMFILFTLFALHIGLYNCMSSQARHL